MVGRDADSDKDSDKGIGPGYLILFLTLVKFWLPAEGALGLGGAPLGDAGPAEEVPCQGLG